MFDDLVILSTTNTPKCRKPMDKHLVGYATIQYMSEGGCRVAYDEERYSLEGAWFFPAYPGPRIRFAHHENYPYWYHRHIGWEGPRWAAWRNAGLWPERPQPAPPGTDWEAYFDEMIFHAHRPTEWGRLRTLHMIESMLIILAEARNAPPQKEPWLDAVLIQIARKSHGHCWEVTDYRALAHSAGIREATFRRKFKQATGTSPHSHFVQRHIAEARRLLGETNLPIKEIATRLGYANVNFFSRQFHSHTRVTPAAFRKKRL